MWKKAITLLLALSAIVTLTACSGNTAGGTNDQINNDERGQAFLSANIPTLSEYLNSDEPVIVYDVVHVKPDAHVMSIRIFQNGTFTYIDTYHAKLTLTDFSEMSDEEIMALADQYYTFYDMRYLLTLHTDLHDETYVESEILWSYNGEGRFVDDYANPSKIETVEINGSYYYGGHHGITVRCKPNTQPYRLDELGTPGIEASSAINYDAMQTKLNEIYTFPGRNDG